MAPSDVKPDIVLDRQSARLKVRRAPMFPVMYFVRNGLVLWAAAIVASTELVAALQRGMQWRGDLIWTIDWLPVSFILVGPVVAGFSAMDTSRVSVGTQHMFRNPVVRTPAFAVAVSYTVIIGLTHLLILGSALVLSLPPAGDAAALLAVLCQILILALFASVGTLCGRFAGPAIAGIAGALVALLLVYLLSTAAHHIGLMVIGGATIPRIGYAYNPSYLAIQSGALLLSIVAVLIVRPVEGPSRLHVTWKDALVATLLITVVATISLTVRSDRLVAIDARPTDCGAVDAIPTCFYPQHRRVSDAFQGQLWILVEAARQKGYGDILPERVEEASRTRLPQKFNPRFGTFFVMPDHLQGQKPTLQEIVLGIVQPLHCPQVQGAVPPSDRYWSDLQALTATWVGLAAPQEVERLGYQGPVLTPKQAAELVEGFRTCTYSHF